SRSGSPWLESYHAPEAAPTPIRSGGRGKTFRGTARVSRPIGGRAGSADRGSARTLPDSDGRAERLGREITMTRWLVIVGLVLGASAAIGVDHAAASMASIVTVAPVVEDEGQAGVEAAVASALRRAVRGAQAMGLDEMMLKSIRLVPVAGVLVEIIAS